MYCIAKLVANDFIIVNLYPMKTVPFITLSVHFCRAKLTTLCDDGHVMSNFAMCRVWGGNTFIMEITGILFDTGRRKPLGEKLARSVQLLRHNTSL